MAANRFEEGLYLSAALREHLDNRASGENGSGDWWVAVQRDNKNPAEFSNSPVGRPYGAKRIFAHDMCKGLNHWVGHGGRWIFVWTHPKDVVFIDGDGIDYAVFHFVWLDGDGDPQFGIICDDNFLEVIRLAPEKWLEDAEEGYRRYCEAERIIDASPRQQFMAARGERAPTRH